MATLPPDWNEFIGLLIAKKVRYLVVGAHALAANGRPRATQDLDIFVERTTANVSRLASALRAFGFVDLADECSRFEQPERMATLGKPPLRVDIMNHIDGVTSHAPSKSQPTKTARKALKKGRGRLTNGRVKSRSAELSWPVPGRIRPIASCSVDRRWLSRRRNSMLLFSSLAVLMTLPILHALHGRPTPFVAGLLITLALTVMSLYTSISGIVKAEMFPPEVRALGVGLSYAIGNALFGGTAEYVALGLKKLGHETWFYGYVTAMMAMTFLVSLRLPRRPSYLHHDR